MIIIWKKHKDQGHTAKNRKYGEIASCIFESHNNAVRLHGCHIHNIESDMETATMYNFTFAHHALTHWKFGLHCCDKFPDIVIPSQ